MLSGGAGSSPQAFGFYPWCGCALSGAEAIRGWRGWLREDPSCSSL